MNVERAIDELRRQSPVVIYETGGKAVSNYPAEFLREMEFQQLKSPDMQLLISAARAKMLGLEGRDVRIDASAMTYADVMAIVDPLCPQAPIANALMQSASPIDSMALKLAKYASLMPALLLTPDSMALRLDAADLKAYIETPHTNVLKTAQASLPIEGAENARLVSFRAQHATSVHLALVIGDITNAPPLTRIHSSCVTGDILGSLRCDCGDQLRLALNTIIKAGNGILIYLHQEGRGIGITNKLRSYQLQERGHDTFTANLMLGFDEDERDFAIASAMLKALGVSTIRMLTNNPSKLEALEKSGTTVSERVPLISETHPHNHAYIEAKAMKAGHLF